jgi:hypothetical protein
MWWQSRTSLGHTRSGPSAASHWLLLIIFALAVPVLDPLRADAASFTVAGATFSDDLGGFVLERVSGRGSMDDPFVLVERMTDPNGGTLEFHVDPAFGNRIGSMHSIGFALIKIVENATSLTWDSFELELQSTLGVPSDYADGLSFGQGSKAGRPFTGSGFGRATIIDEPYDRVEFDQGRIPIRGQTTLRFVITESLPLAVAYLLQRPMKPIALGPATKGMARVETNPPCEFRLLASIRPDEVLVLLLQMPGGRLASRSLFPLVMMERFHGLCSRTHSASSCHRRSAPDADHGRYA